MAVQDAPASRASASSGLVLQVADKQHTITALELLKHPNSLLSKLATADLATGGSNAASNAKVLQLDCMSSTPLVSWPESAAPIICSLYRVGHIALDLLDSLLVIAASSSTCNTSSRSSSGVGGNGSSTSSRGSLGSVYDTMYMQLLKLLDYLQLSSSAAGADSVRHSILTQWLPRAADVPLRCTRVLRFLYYCFAAEAVQVMLSYRPHGNGQARGFSRPSSAVFLLILDKGTADPSLCVRALAVKADLAGNGLRTAASSQVFSDSNSSVIRNLNAVRADALGLNENGVCKRSGSWQTAVVRDVKDRAVAASHPLFGQAVQDALLAAVCSTGLGAGFTWVKGEGEAVPSPLAGGMPQRAQMARAPVWVLWW